MLHIWKYLREVIVIVGICGEIKQRKTTSQIGIPIRIIQWRLNVEKTVFTLCLHTPSQYFDKLLSMRVCGYGDFVQVRPPAYLISERNTVEMPCFSYFLRWVCKQKCHKNVYTFLHSFRRLNIKCFFQFLPFLFV